MRLEADLIDPVRGKPELEDFRRIPAGMLVLQPGEMILRDELAQFADRPDFLQGFLVRLGSADELPVAAFGKDRKLPAPVLQDDSDRANAVRGEVLPELNLLDGEVEAFPSRPGSAFGPEEPVLSCPPGEEAQVYAAQTK